MGIELDHFIVGGEEYISLEEFGAIFKNGSKECEKLNLRKMKADCFRFSRKILLKN